MTETFIMPTVIGHGLLARSMAPLAISKGCLILAAGVSNSHEERASEFEREIDVVRCAIRAHPFARAIYFSTCSVVQDRQTPYTRHKANMESIVAGEAASFQIYRLPQVVGVTRNLTLVSHFVEAVLGRRQLTIQSLAKRNLLGANDVGRMVLHLVENGIDVNTVRTLVSGRSVPVLDILQVVADILSVRPQFDVVHAGEDYEFSADFVRAQFGADDAVLGEAYWQSVLTEYVPLMAAQSMEHTACTGNAESAS